MKIDNHSSFIDDLSLDIDIKVFLPDGYELSEKRYPVLYVNDGQDVFFDKDSYQGKSLNFAQYYTDYKKYLPEFIIVAIAAPSNPSVRTALYSPFHKKFDVPAEKNFEKEIKGNGKIYLDWMTKSLKKMIDMKYKTKPEKEYTGICGYSTGGLNAIYAVIKYSHIFSRAIIMSGAFYIWMDCLIDVLKESNFNLLKYLYLDIGTNEFGRMTTKEEFIEGTETLYNHIKKQITNPGILKYNIYPDAMHNQTEWEKRFPDAIRWIFQDL